MRRLLRKWLSMPTTNELIDENRALRMRLHILRDALEQTAWRTRMNIHIVDNAAAHNIAMCALVRDLKHDEPPRPWPSGSIATTANH